MARLMALGVGTTHQNASDRGKHEHQPDEQRKQLPERHAGRRAAANAGRHPPRGCVTAMAPRMGVSQPPYSKTIEKTSDVSVVASAATTLADAAHSCGTSHAERQVDAAEAAIRLRPQLRHRVAGGSLEDPPPAAPKQGGQAANVVGSLPADRAPPCDQDAASSRTHTATSFHGALGSSSAPRRLQGAEHRDDQSIAAAASQRLRGGAHRLDARRLNDGERVEKGPLELADAESRVVRRAGDGGTGVGDQPYRVAAAGQVDADGRGRGHGPFERRRHSSPRWATRAGEQQRAPALPGLLLAAHHQLAERAVERQCTRRRSSPWRYSRVAASSSPAAATDRARLSPLPAYSPASRTDGQRLDAGMTSAGRVW